MHAVGDLVAHHELPACGMPGYHNPLQVGEDLLSGQLAHNLIHEVERSDLLVARLTPSGAPVVRALGIADPVCFVLSQNVSAITCLIAGGTALRCKAGSNDYRIFQF